MAIAERLRSDLRLGVSQSAEDIAVAALVTMPFTLTLAVLLGWVVPMSSIVLQLFWLLLTIAATVWNAGWRARTGTEEA